MALRVISLLVGRMKFHWARKYFLVCWPSSVHWICMVCSALDMLSGCYIRLEICFAYESFSPLLWSVEECYAYWGILPLKSYVVNFHTQVSSRDYKFFKGPIPHGNWLECYLRTHCFCIRNLTCSLPAFVWFLIHQQLVRRSRNPLFMTYFLYLIVFVSTFSCRLLTSGRIRSL